MLSRPDGRLGRNVAWGVLAQLCGMAAALATTPVILRGLGAADYGLWNVAGAVGQWLGFVNMIFSTAAIHYVGRALGAGDRSSCLEAHRALTRWSIVFAAGAAAVLAAASPWLARSSLNVEPERISLASAALTATAALIAFQILGSVGSGVLGAHQRLDAVQIIRILMTVLQSSAAALLVLAGGGLAAVAWCAAAVQALEWGAYSWWAARLQGPAAGPAAVPMGPWLRRLADYGGHLLAGFASAQLQLPMSRFLLGFFRPTQEVAYFAVPVILAGNVRVFSTQVAGAVLPALSEAAGRGDEEELRTIYLRGLRWSWLAMVPLAGLVVALGGEFIGAWIGPDFGREAAPLVPLLTMGLCVQFLGGVPSMLAQGLGRLGPWAWAGVAMGVGNSALALLWIPRWGALGAAWALAVSGFLPTIGMIVWSGRTLNIPWRRSVEALDWRVLLCSAAVAWALASWRPMPAARLWEVAGWGALGAAALLASSPWYLRPEERAWLRGLAARLRFRMGAAG